MFTGAGVSWNPISNLALIGSATIPFGPGNNSFNSDLDFKRLPVFNIGVNYEINPRI